MLYLSFKFVRKFKFCVSPLVKQYLGVKVVFDYNSSKFLVITCIKILRGLLNDKLNKYTFLPLGVKSYTILMCSLVYCAGETGAGEETKRTTCHVTENGGHTT